MKSGVTPTKSPTVSSLNEIHSFFNQVPAGIAIVAGAKHIFTFANPLFNKIVNRENNELLGRTLREAFPKIEGHSIHTILDNVYETGKAYVAHEYHFHIDSKDKENAKDLYFNFVAQPMRDQDKKIHSILIHVFEVTDYVVVRQQVLASEKYYRALIENSADVVTLRDREGVLIYVTPSVTSMLGYTPQEYRAYNKWDIIHPDDQKPLRKIYQEARKEIGKPFRYQTRVRHKNGTWRWIEGVATDLMNDPVVKGVVSNFRDITREKESEEMLEQSEARLRSATDAADVGTWRYNLQTGKTTRDASLNKMLSSQSEVTEVASESFLQFVHPEDKKMVQANVRNLYTNKADLDIEFRLFRADGSIRWVRDRGKVIFDKNKQPLYAAGAFVDITQQKHLEKQKDEFLGIASHELKTPVTSIKAYTQVLNYRFRKAGDTSSAELVEKMNGQLNKLTVLINDLLDVTKIESGKLVFHEEYFDLNELIDEIVEEMQRTTTKHVLSKELTTSKAIWGDRDRIGQVLTNLLTNAIKYSPDHDKIIIKTQKKNKLMLLSVQDFGLGIPKEKQKKVFDRFFRVEGKIQKTFPGLGLGLYISTEIVKRHKGTLWFESTQGKGSTFYISLPLSNKKQVT